METLCSRLGHFPSSSNKADHLPCLQYNVKTSGTDVGVGFNDVWVDEEPGVISKGFHAEMLADGWPELLPPWNKVVFQTEKQGENNV